MSTLEAKRQSPAVPEPLPQSREERILREVRALLDKRSHWTQCTLARDATGHVVAVMDPDATKFCLMGAIGRSMHRVLGADERGCGSAVSVAVSVIAILRSAAIAVDDATWDGCLAKWNDYRGRHHSEIIAAIDRAIARLQRYEQAMLEFAA